ncbi:hypothetical protein [Rhizobium leguminosarum]|uniref:hypothetical protein n=1 Tax=Rhizobium leguminosarum TaxID=384 RepID=UPI0010301653|nr:hypothetical protein [Rhizobium leguminosarum]TAV81573.1 hypothetical protein ELI22_34025 [Rhizobium leguminosarum]TAV94179.1 hypothetical protein ELI21_10420 [Rhizobium leguminosarum]TAW35254.1 hypothetical protein ELI23_10460 [Rhizobium leguminosarum]
MNLAFFLRQRTSIIRLFYDNARVPFEQLKRDIEEEVPPWEPPPFDPDYDSSKPPYMEQWTQAEQTRELVGMMAVSLLSDTLKLYFDTPSREIGLSFSDDKERKDCFKSGVVEGYRRILSETMGDEFETLRVRFDVIEQVVLARNDIAHNSDFLSFRTRHNEKTIQKHPTHSLSRRLMRSTLIRLPGGFEQSKSRATDGCGR